MTRLLKTTIICILTVGLALGSMAALSLDVSPYRLIFGEARWQTKVNNFMDATAAAMAAVSAQITNLGALISGWAIEDNIVVLVTSTPTYSSGTAFTVPGDYTSRLTAGKVIQAQVAAGMVYSTVASSTYAAPNTTVNLNDSVLTDPITRVYVVATRDGLWPNGPGYVVAADYGTDEAALAAADTVAAAAGKQLLIGRAYSVTSDLTLAAPIRQQPGAILTIAANKTLTINGSLDAGLYQIFSCTGTGKVVFGAATPRIKAPWWGTDQTALAAADVAAAAAGKQLFISWPYSITSDLTLTSAIKATPGAVLSIATTKTVTFSKTFEAGLHQVFDCTNTGKVIFGIGVVTQVRPEWFGAARDDVTDDSSAIKAAIASLSWGEVAFSPGIYKCDAVLSYPSTVKLNGNGAFLDFSALTGAVDAVTVTAATVTVPGTGAGAWEVLRDITLLGDVTNITTPTYLATVNGLNIKTSNTVCRNVIVRGFNHSLQIDNVATYTNKFYSCEFNYNNYGPYCNLSATAELLGFFGCDVCGNNYGIYNSYGDFVFTGGSWDYNKIANVARNNCRSGGNIAGRLVWIGSYFENTVAKSPAVNTRFINSNGIMQFTNCKFHDDTTLLVWDNTAADGEAVGEIHLEQPNLFLLEAQYMCLAGRLTLNNPTYIDQSRRARMMASLSGLYNGDFETGTLTDGWSLTGTNATLDNTLAYIGTYSLKLSRTSAGEATVVTSTKSPIPYGKTLLNVTAFYKNADATENGFLNVVVFNSAGIILSTSSGAALVHATSAWTMVREEIALPPGAATYSGVITAGNTVTGWVNVDEVYAHFE